MQYLFPYLDTAQCAWLDGFTGAVDRVYPLNSAHRQDLPRAISDLSEHLTSERSALFRPYWVTPRFVSAYLRYFMPWNIIRQARILAALPLEAPVPAEDGTPRLLIDAGSGPLTFVFALWLARPGWRKLPLDILALDLSPHILELGRDIFRLTAGKDCPWNIRLRRGGVETLSRAGQQVPGTPWLINMANMLNELKEDEDRGGEILEQCRVLMRTADCRALFIEPGTRLGGKNIMRLRTLAEEYNLRPETPCPHTGNCPLESGRTWCHFTFDTQGAPLSLKRLSETARLQKESLSLSFLLLSPVEEEFSPEQEEHTAQTPSAERTGGAAGHISARIVSAPFAVPGLRGHARYACTERSFALLEDAGSLPSGALVEIRWPESPAMDKKSGAYIIPADRHEYPAAPVRSSEPPEQRPRRSEDRNNGRADRGPRRQKDGAKKNSGRQIRPRGKNDTFRRPDTQGKPGKRSPRRG